MQDLRNRTIGAVRKFCRSAEAGSSEISEGGLPSWSREARKLGVLPETFWRLQAPATAREISSWY